MTSSRTEMRLVSRPRTGASTKEIDAWILAIGGRELTPEEARAWDEREGVDEKIVRWACRIIKDAVAARKD